MAGMLITFVSELDTRGTAAAEPARIQMRDFILVVESLWLTADGLQFTGRLAAFIVVGLERVAALPCDNDFGSSSVNLSISSIQAWKEPTQVGQGH